MIIKRTEITLMKRKYKRYSLTIGSCNPGVPILK